MGYNSFATHPAIRPEECLDVHQLGPGFEEPGRIGVVWRSLWGVNLLSNPASCLSRRARPHRQQRWGAQAVGRQRYQSLATTPAIMSSLTWGVDLRGRDIHVPEEGLDLIEIGAGLAEPRGIGMPELVGGDLFVDPGPLDRRYQVLAKELGLDVAEAGAFGWSSTTIRDVTIKEYRRELRRLQGALTLYRRGELTARNGGNSHHHPCQGPLRSVFPPGQGPLLPNAVPDTGLLEQEIERPFRSSQSLIGWASHS